MLDLAKPLIRLQNRLLGGPEVTNPPISQALSLRAHQGVTSTGSIVHTERHAVVVSEIELRNVAVQVLLTAVLVKMLKLPSC